MKNYDLCIIDANSAIKLDKKYVKAYHRRGKAQMELNKHEDALADFEYIMELEPQNAEANADLMNCRESYNREMKK